MTGGVSLRRTDATVGGIRCPVLQGGSGDASDAVVFVHGNPGSSEDWRPLASEVSSFARVVAPDMPGFGKADKPADFPYTVDAYASHLGTLLDELGVPRAHLVLHDFGGPWALTWAARRPEAVASVVLIDTGAILGDRWHWLGRVWRTRVAGEVSMATSNRPAFRMMFKRGNPRGLPGDLVDRMYADFDRGTRRAVLRIYRSADDMAGTVPQVIAALRPLDLPALVLWGRGDPYISVDLAERQREVFPSAEVVVLEESGHWPFADDPEATAAAVVPFLRAQVGTASSG